MVNKLFFISLLSGMTLLFTSCGGKNATSSKNAAEPDVDKLWTMLNGYWKYIDPAAGVVPEELQDIFYFYGYDDKHNPVSYLIWGYEMGETEYITEVAALDEHRYRVTFEVLAIEEEEGLFDPHETYSDTYEFDLKHFANKKLIVSYSGEISEWEFVGKTLEDLDIVRGR